MHTQYCWHTTYSYWKMDLLIKTWPYLIENENKVKDIRQMPDWHEILICIRMPNTVDLP